MNIPTSPPMLRERIRWVEVVSILLIAGCFIPRAASASSSATSPAEVETKSQLETEHQAGKDRPNFLFVTSDDHRWDALGAAGNSAIHTPNLDALAAEGVYFEQATVNVSQCLPIRASLLTGLAVQTHGAYAHQNQAPRASQPTSFSDIPTLPSLLRDAGYQTVLVGKWHLASDPWRVGFQDVRTWLPSGGEKFEDPSLCQGKSRDRKVVRGNTQEIFTGDALDFLGSPESKQKPFMLWLAYTAPHAPFAPNPDRIKALYRNKSTADLLPPGFPKGIPTNDWLHYYEAVSHLDEQVGLVLKALEKAGLAKTTTVVFLGDNGFMMGERGIGAQGGKGKVVPYESSVRVPLIVRAPGLQSFEGASSAALSALDLPPTFLRLAGLDPPANWPGRDASPALRDAKAPGFEDAFSEWADDQSKPFGHFAHRLVRTPRYKFIVWKDKAKPAELYDLVDDPREMKNLVGMKEFAEVEKEMRGRLAAWEQKVKNRVGHSTSR